MTTSASRDDLQPTHLDIGAQSGRSNAVKMTWPGVHIVDAHEANAG